MEEGSKTFEDKIHELLQNKDSNSWGELVSIARDYSYENAVYILNIMHYEFKTDGDLDFPTLNKYYKSIQSLVLSKERAETIETTGKKTGRE